MAPVEKYSLVGGVGHLGIRLVLRGGDTGGPDFWIRVLGSVGCNDEDGKEHPCGVPI